MRDAARTLVQTIGRKMSSRSCYETPGAVQFVFPDLGGAAFYLYRDGQEFSVFEGRYSCPELIIEAPVPTLLNIITGEVFARRPPESEQITIEGKTRYLFALMANIPPESTADVRRFFDLDDAAADTAVDTVQRHSASCSQTLLDCISNSAPLVLTDVMKHWNFRAAWTFDYLSETYGDEILASKKYPSLTLAEEVRMVLGQLCMVTRGYPVPQRLSAELGPVITSERIRVGEPLLYTGSLGGKAQLHRHPNPVINVHVIGRKEWTLFPPHQTPFLYPRLPKPSYQMCDFTAADADYDSYPMFRHAKPLKVVVEAGESLLLPAGWYHEVRVLEPALSLVYGISLADSPD